MPYGETGEIVINTKTFMMGYLNNESDTNISSVSNDTNNKLLPSTMKIVQKFDNNEIISKRKSK